MFLVDGTPAGVLTAEIINWTGSVSVAPRTQLSELSMRPETSRTGIYFLVGPDPSDEFRPLIYIGEGDSVGKRLAAHSRGSKKSFWTQAIVVTSKDENLTKSHVRYLESKLIRMALDGGRATVTNGTGPDPPKIPESDIADMDYFLAQIELILPTLGFDFIQPRKTIRPPSQAANSELVFVIESVGAFARAVERGKEFVVLKGSTARKLGTKSWVNGKIQREHLVNEGSIEISDDPDFLVFKMDTPFASPSTAASIVSARQRNGRSAWKVEDTNETYAEWQDAKLATVVERWQET